MAHMRSKMGMLLLVGVMAAACEYLPGSDRQQATAIGGTSTPATSASASNNRALSPLIAGLTGTGSGYLIGAQIEKISATAQNRQQALQAVNKAQNQPATPADVGQARTADLNNDGFLTTDEPVAMSRAGLSDRDMLDRIAATDQVIELTPSQEESLVNQGVSRYVVREMQNLNRAQRDQVLSRQQKVQ